MFVSARSAVLVGVCAQTVVVEAQAARGLPGIVLVGMARGPAKEALVRVRSALLGRGVALSGQRRVVNLLPADLPKDSSSLDLALAAVLLAQAGAVPAQALAGRRFYGEVSLGGGVEAVRGSILIADLARQAGDNELLLPEANAAEAAIIPGVRVVGVSSLDALMAHLTGRCILPAAVSAATNDADATPHLSAAMGCLSEVHGQARGKRALEIAAAGGHNLLLVGPPGSGKTMLARRLVGLLPDLSESERIEVTRIHATVGHVPPAGLMRARPFRAPHHTATAVALCGGGLKPRPGEVTLAHRGVLFLDELPEFQRSALEALREPLEEGAIHVARASMSLRFPAELMLVAAMNPCPCGFFGAPPGARVCLCAFAQLQRYRARISGPLLDRIDLHVAAEAVPFEVLMAAAPAETSEQVRVRVRAARQRQADRLGIGRVNASMDAATLRRDVPLTASGRAVLNETMRQQQLSARSLGRILKVARTLADLAGVQTVLPAHLLEATQFHLLGATGPHFGSEAHGAII